MNKVPLIQQSVSDNYFDTVSQAFVQAADEAGGRVDRFFSVGRHILQLRFAGRALVDPITQAFAHLAIDPHSKADLTVDIWDSKSSGMDMPSPPWDVKDYIESGEVWRLSTQRLNIYYQPANETYYMLDKELKRAIFRISDASFLAQFERGSPLLQILHWYMSGENKQIIHAGAIAQGDKGVLLVGKGGTGKSVAALACLNSSLKYLADDYCLFCPNPEPSIYSLYNSGKVRAADLQRFSFLPEEINSSVDSDSGKALYFVSHLFPQKVITRAGIKAILIPQVVLSAVPDISRVSSAVAFRALAPSTIFQLRGGEGHAFRGIGQLVKQLPCYVFRLGDDMDKIPEIISNVLADL